VSPYELVQAEKAHFPVSLLCEAVGVSRSAFYAWLRGTPSDRALVNERGLSEIRAIHSEHRERYGTLGCEPSCATGASTSANIALLD
jgi:putative transposase